MSGPTRFDVEAHVTCMSALAQAILALGKARDLTVMATGNSLAGASLQVLTDAANGLLNEMGAVLVGMRNSEDVDTRNFVRAVLAQIHETNVGAAVDPGTEA